MASRWIAHFFDETDLEGSHLLLALALADHADAKGLCWPGLDKLVRKVRPLKKRRIQSLMADLERWGHVEIVRGIGRGNFTKFQLKKMSRVAPIKAAKKGAISSIKGAIPSAEKVQSSDIPIYMEEPKEEPIEPIVEKPSKATPSDHARAMSFLKETIGPFIDGGAQGKALKWMLDNGIILEDIFKHFPGHVQDYQAKGFRASYASFAKVIHQIKSERDRSSAGRLPTVEEKEAERELQRQRMISPPMSAAEKSAQRGANAIALIDELRRQGKAQRLAKTEDL